LKVARVLHEHNRLALAEYSSHLKKHYAIEDSTLTFEVPPIYTEILGIE
jgi:hypothetical protein